MQSCKPFAEIHPITVGPRHHVFGFHDLCPWDESGRHFLTLEVDFIDRPPEPDDRAMVGLIDLEQGGMFEPLAPVTAWNFQQGARQQWVPKQPTKIIYNDRIGDRFCGVVLDVQSGQRCELPIPVYAVDPGGAFGLGLNFARLQNLGGYGYPGGFDATQDIGAPEEDGIYRVDLKTGRYGLLLSIAQVANLENACPIESEQRHFLTHVVFSPDGSRICFAHKYWLRDGGARIRLLTANPDGTDLHCLPGEVTHFTWLNDRQILAWGRNRPLLAKLREKNWFAHPALRPALRVARRLRSHARQRVLGDCYMLLADRTGRVEPVGIGLLTEDGHPSAHPDGEWVITDTYADKNHYRTLILYNLKTNRRVDLGRFYSLPDPAFYRSADWQDSEMRSDLHPRWNRRGTQVCIDSVHEGTRQIYVVDLEPLIQSA